jgi:hypothetical protein
MILDFELGGPKLYMRGAESAFISQSSGTGVTLQGDYALRSKTPLTA